MVLFWFAVMLTICLSIFIPDNSSLVFKRPNSAEEWKSDRQNEESGLKSKSRKIIAWTAERESKRDAFSKTNGKRGRSCLPCIDPRSLDWWSDLWLKWNKKFHSDSAFWKAKTVREREKSWSTLWAANEWLKSWPEWITIDKSETTWERSMKRIRTRKKTVVNWA